MLESLSDNWVKCDFKTCDKQLEKKNQLKSS